MVEFAGWEMPQQYSSVKEEQRAVRTGAGIFDVSHMGRYLIEGSSAGELLQGVLTNDLTRITDFQAQYTLMCREDGGILDDLVIYRGLPWRMVVNAANRSQDLAWLRAHAPAGVTISDISDDFSLLALQGPRAEELLPAKGVNLAALPFYSWAQGDVAGVPVLISRTGYTGEDGFEVFVPAHRVASVWEALLAGGAVPCGLAARDVCRLEAGLRLYGADMDAHTNPYQAGLGWTVKLEKGSFLGREALTAAKAKGPDWTLIGIEGAGQTIPRHGARLWQTEDKVAEVGVVTSGTYSFWLQKGIGMASVAADAARAGEHLGVETRGGRSQAQIVKMPFYRGSVRR
jgi:aminomethyltransferase